MWQPKPRSISLVIKPIIHGLILTPLAYLIFSLLTNQLGANPVEAVTHSTGGWGLRLLLLTLLVSPLRTLTGIAWLTQLRRLIGLWAFFYILLHLLIFIILDHSLIVRDIWQDIVKRPYITVGMLAFTLMLPLAITSFTKLRRKMGANWNRLHRLVYLIAPLGVIHFWLLVKADITEPLIYGMICAFLLILRLSHLKRWLSNRF